MPYPYTLLPDGHTLEPEEDQQVERPISAPVPLFPWLVPQPELDPEPEVTSVTPMIKLVPPLPPAPPGLHVPPPPTVQQPQPEPTSETTRPSQTVRLGEQILRRNQERARQDAAAQNREPSRPDISQLFGESPFLDATGLATSGSVKPDIGQDAVQVFCEALSEASPEGVASTVRLMCGADLDDEEQSPVEEMVKLVRSAGFVEHFENEPWYTTRLGPTASSAGSLFQNGYVDRAFANGQGVLQPGGRVNNAVLVQIPGSETQTIDGTTRAGEETDERWYRGIETELDPYLRRALTQTFSAGTLGKWNEEWTQLEDLESFLKDRLARFFTKDFIENELQWDKLTGFGMIHMHRSLLEALWGEHWSVEGKQDPWISSLNVEFADADDLLSAVSAVPLVNEARLLEEFEYASVEEARNNLLAQVQYAYETFDIRPPEDLHEWSVLQLANEYHSLLTNVYLPYRNSESNLEDYFKADDFVIGFTSVNFTVLSPKETRDRLDGSYRESPMELVFFVASFFIEPLDWALTIRDMINAAEDGDWEQFALLGLTGLAPGALGRFVKRGKADELLDAAQSNALVSKVPDSYQRPGSGYVQRAKLEDFRSGSSNNSAQLRREARDARESAPTEFESLHPTGADTEFHHTVPAGEPWSAGARRILLDKGIHPNSAYNGVALTRSVHRNVVHRERRVYAEALNRAIHRLEFETPEAIDEFLAEAGRKLYTLNSLPENSPELAQAFSQLLDWVNGYGL